MKTSLLSFFMIAALILLSSKKSEAQTNTFPSTGAAGIGTTSPDPSSLLDVFSTSKGVLIPRMTRIQRDAITTPSTGLLIFQTNSTPGFYYYTGSAWVPISAKGANTALSNLAATTSVNQSLLPNITSTLDLGSSSLKWRDIYTGSLKFSDGTQQTTASQWITNGSNIYFNGAVGIGVLSPAYKLDIFGDINLVNGNVLRVGGTPMLALNTSSGNIAVGQSALLNNTTGYSDIAIGAHSLQSNSTQHNIVAIGDSALYNNGTGASSSLDGSANTAVGSKALFNNTTGRANSAFGLQSSYSNTTGIHNTSSGYQALYSNTTGNENMAAGYHALYSNIDGYSNVAIGVNALNNNTAGHNLVAIGDSALFNQSVGNSNNYANTALGTKTLFSNTSGYENTAAGSKALYSNTTGHSNVAVGIKALYTNTDRNNLVAIGDSALFNNGKNVINSFDATNNTAVGSKALYSNTTGLSNTANGFRALYGNGSGSYNTANGENALASNSAGVNNTADGNGALSFNVSGNDNTANGFRALYGNTIGSDNTAIGFSADVATYNLTNATAIGFSARVDASNKVSIGNTSVTKISGQVSWTTFSDGRYKKNIKEDVKGLLFINSLRPITYTVDINGLNEYYNKGRKHDSAYEKMKTDMQPSADAASKIVYSGFVAQEVEATAKKLNYNFSGVDKPKTEDGLYGLRYSDFVVPLVKAVQELSSQNDNKQRQIDSLKINNQVLNDKLNSITNKIDQIESAMSQCCSSFSSALNSSNNNSSITKNSDQPRLEQNVPNPFDGSCYIGYYIPSDTHNAQLRITDVRGHVLKTYSLSTSGYGKQTIYGSELSSGMYQYSLFIDGKLIDTKKMERIR